MDPSFGTGGQVIIPVAGKHVQLNQLVELPLDYIAVGKGIDPQNQTAQGLIVKINEYNGSLDTSFPGNGKYLLPSVVEYFAVTPTLEEYLNLLSLGPLPSALQLTRLSP